jgi:hypothetical protein
MALSNQRIQYRACDQMPQAKFKGLERVATWRFGPRQDTNNWGALRGVG